MNIERESKKQIQCDECQGDGENKFMRRSIPGMKILFEPCLKCGGSGFVTPPLQE